MSDRSAIDRRAIDRRAIDRRALGRAGESDAVSYLEARGYRVVDTNVTFRGGELDIVAYHDDTLCFIEVRSTASERYGSPLATISSTKQRRLVRAARLYLAKHAIRDVPMRFDVLGIVRAPASFTLVTNAFDAHDSGW
jgi:putative endonuclease